MAKILWHGDAGCTTGFARVTHEICSQLADKWGHEIHVVGVNFRGDPDYNHLPFKIYNPRLSRSDDTYGFSRIGDLLNKIQPDVFVAFNDIPIIIEDINLIKDLAKRQVLHCKPFAVMGYFPIDGDDPPPSWMRTISELDVAVTYTEWARKEILKKNSYLTIDVAGHGSSPHFYQVSSSHSVALMNREGVRVSARTKDEAKHLLGLDDKFVVLWADRNSPRKAPQVFLKEVAPFLKEHKDAVVWMHCSFEDAGGNISVFVEKYEIDPTQVYATRGLNTFMGIPDEDLNALYNASDVKVSTSMGEGWGLTNHEALQCGVPVIAMDNSVNLEVLGNGAVLVNASYAVTTDRGLDFWYPEQGAYTRILERLYNFPGERAKIGAAGIKHVKQWTWEKAANNMELAIQRALDIRAANTEEL